MANNKVYLCGDSLSDTEWQELERALVGSRYADVPAAMRAANNDPTPARTVLPANSVLQGHEHANTLLRNKGVPYRLVRIGSWKHGEKRCDRLLAFIRW